MGGRDCLFLLKSQSDEQALSLQIFVQNNCINLAVKNYHSRKIFDVAYHNIAMLKGRQNMQDTVTMISCAIQILDTNGGNDHNRDLIFVTPVYQPCASELVIVLRNYTSVVNSAQNGSFVYHVYPTTVASTLTIRKPSDMFHNASHDIFLMASSNLVKLDMHRDNNKEDKYIFDIKTEMTVILTINYEVNEVITCNKIRLIFIDGVTLYLGDKTVQVTRSSAQNSPSKVISQLQLLFTAEDPANIRTLVSETEVLTHFQFDIIFPSLKPGIQPGSLDVFITNPDYSSEIDHAGTNFLVDVTPNCVMMDFLHLERCDFKTVHLKRLPHDTLVVSFSELCFALVEEHAIVEPSVEIQSAYSKLEVNVHVVQRNSGFRKHLGSVLLNINNYNSESNPVIVLNLETMMILNTKYSPLTFGFKPLPVVIDQETEVVIVLPETAVRPLVYKLERYIAAYNCYIYHDTLFVVAFQCFQVVDQCLPNLTFVLLGYNDNISQFAFPVFEIVSEGENYLLKR